MPVLITNNSNSHPPEAWAVATAQLLFDVGADVASNRRIPALKLQTAIAEELVSHYIVVQQDEQMKLDNNADEHFETPHEVEPYLDRAVEAVKGLAVGTPWQSDFEAPEMTNKIRSVLADHFATAQHVQRQAHTHANPLLESGKKFMAKVHGLVGE